MLSLTDSQKKKRFRIKILWSNRILDSKTYTESYIEQRNDFALTYKVKSNKGYGDEYRSINLLEGTCDCTQFIQQPSPCVLKKLIFIDLTIPDPNKFTCQV